MQPQKSGPPRTATELASASPLAAILNELLQGYRRPAVAVTGEGNVVGLNAAAMRLIEEVNDDADAEIQIDVSKWPRVAAFQADGVVLHLALPSVTPDAAPDTKPLPPRLLKIARLVVAGCTDKQIATQTGLSFSTVRTYVRQIYRRFDVHSRVELVNISVAPR